MGNSEFEWGVIPETLKQIFNLGLDKAEIRIDIDEKELTVYLVFWKGFPFNGYIGHIKDMATGKSRHVEPIFFNRAVQNMLYPNQSQQIIPDKIDIWFDIKNGVMFMLSKLNQRNCIKNLYAIQKAWETQKK